MTGPNPNIHPGQGGVTYPSPNEFPVTYRAITGITKGITTKVTVPNHGFTNANDQNITQLDFTQVKGMTQINGKFGYILNVIDINNLLIGLDSSTFQTYTSGGNVNINGGNAPYDPFENIFP